MNHARTEANCQNSSLNFAALFPKLKPAYGRIQYNMQMAGGHYTGTPTSLGKR
jgi:hypothetical protein